LDLAFNGDYAVSSERNFGQAIKDIALEIGSRKHGDGKIGANILVVKTGPVYNSGIAKFS